MTTSLICGFDRDCVGFYNESRPSATCLSCKPREYRLAFQEKKPMEPVYMEPTREVPLSAIPISKQAKRLKPKCTCIKPSNRKAALKATKAAAQAAKALNARHIELNALKSDLQAF